MELIGSLFLILALVLVVALILARPFLFRASRTADGMDSFVLTAEQEREHLRSSLLAERDRVLNALQELDFDFALGKVPSDEYPNQRAVLLKNGADVLRRLDELSGKTASAESVSVAVDESAEERIEAAVAARRADGSMANDDLPYQAAQTPVIAAGTNGKSKVKDPLEDLIASRKRERKETAAGFCPSCGRPVQKSDKFCSKCGATL